MLSNDGFFEDEADVTTMIDEFIAEHGETELLDKIREDIAGILEPEELEKVELSITGLEGGHARLELSGPDEITRKLEEALSDSETRCDF